MVNETKPLPTFQGVPIDGYNGSRVGFLSGEFGKAVYDFQGGFYSVSGRGGDNDDLITPFPGGQGMVAPGDLFNSIMKKLIKLPQAGKISLTFLAELCIAMNIQHGNKYVGDGNVPFEVAPLFEITIGKNHFFPQSGIICPV